MSTRAKRLLAASAALGVAMTLGACSGDDEKKDSAPSPEPSSSSAAPTPIATDLKVGVVTGKLPRPARQKASGAVGHVVDGWLDAAYLGSYPSGRKQLTDSSFDGFTKTAGQRASRQAAITTNAALAGQIDGAVAKRRAVKVDLFAPKGKPVAARANVALLFNTSGDAEQRRRVNASLDLTKVKGKWRVFAFDVTNDRVPPHTPKASKSADPSAGPSASKASKGPNEPGKPGKGASKSSKESQ